MGSLSTLEAAIASTDISMGKSFYESDNSLAKIAKLAEVQDATYQSMLDTLERTHLCNVERPTGFGKTKTFMCYAKNHPDMRILYVFDTNAVLEDIQSKCNPDNVDFISYICRSGGIGRRSGIKIP